MKAIVGIVLIAGFAIYGGSSLIGMVRGTQTNVEVPAAPPQASVPSVEAYAAPSRPDFVDAEKRIHEVRSRPPKPRCHWTRGRLYWDYDDHEMKYVAGRCVYDDQ